MRTVADADPYGHPTSLHTTVTTDAFGADREHSFISHQRKGTPEELRVLVASSRIFDKPVINLEYGYEGDPRVFSANQAPHLVRRDHYALTLAGGYGVYGNHTPWYSTYHRVGDFVLEATDTPGAEYLQILFEFFAATSFHRLEPAQGLVDRASPPRGRDASTSYSFRQEETCASISPPRRVTSSPSGSTRVPVPGRASVVFPVAHRGRSALRTPMTGSFTW